MAKGQFNLRCRANDDAEYRAYCLAIIGIFTACGLVLTNDTGQADFAVVNKPGGNNQAPHYKIFRFDDALQATAPVFIKLWFGTSYSYADMPTIFIQVATGTDGAGNLTGKLSKQRRILNPPMSAPNNQYEFACIYTGGEANRLGFWLHYNSQWISVFYLQAAFIIERTRDAAGAVTNEGVSIFMWHYPDQNEGVYHTNQMLLFAENGWSDWNDKSACGIYLRNGEPSSFYQGKVAAAPVYPVKNGMMVYNPIISLMAGLDRDYAHDVTVQIEHYGQMRTFLKMSYGAAFWGSYLNWVEGAQRDRTRGLILWED